MQARLGPGEQAMGRLDLVAQALLCSPVPALCGFARGAVTPSQGTCTGSADFTCSLGTIAASDSATVTVTYTVPPSTTTTLQVNSVTVSSTTTDPNAANNTATDSNTVATSANLSATKTDGVETVTAGDGEAQSNPRSRSAKLRAAQRTGG